MRNSNAFKFIFARDYFKDRTIVLLFLSLTAVLVIDLLLIVLFTDATEQHVKVGYSGYGVGDFTRGSGYDHYIFGLFGILSYVSVVALSIKTFNVRKSLSILQLYLGVVVLVMLFFVSRALILG